MKTIDEDIKSGNLRRAYLLFGEERYLILQYRDKIKKAIVAEGDTMNFNVYEGKDIDPREVIAQAQTLPFFADRRLVLVENSGFFKKTPKDLEEEFGALSPDTTIVFVEEEVDKRSSLYKAVAKSGHVAEFSELSGSLLARWVGSRVRKEGKNITNGAYELFISKTGTQMQNIDRELEKLICYAWDRDVIGTEDVEAVTTAQLDSKIYNLTDAILAHDQTRALGIFYELLSMKEEVPRIQFSIMHNFQDMLTVRSMLNQGYSKQDIVSKMRELKVREWVTEKLIRQSRSFSVERIRDILQEGVNCEEMYKSGQMNMQMAVELFLVQCSR